MTNDNYAMLAGRYAENANQMKRYIEKNLPYFVFVEGVPQIDTPAGQPADEKYPITGNIAFCGKDLAPIFSLGKNGYYTLDNLGVNYIRKYLYRIRPMKNEDGSGWIIPLYEGNDFSSLETVNAYFHNLMFWESQLPKKYSGPLTMRIVGSMMTGDGHNWQSCGAIAGREPEPRPWQAWALSREFGKMHSSMMYKMRMEELRNAINKKMEILRQAEAEQQHNSEVRRIYEREFERFAQSAADLRSEIRNLEEELNTLSENVKHE